MPRRPSSKLCTVEFCDKPHYAKGLCNTHYRRQLRTGSVNKRLPIGPRYCAMGSCSERHYCRGYCQHHYEQIRYRRKRWYVHTPPATADGWKVPTYPPLVAYLEDRRRRGIPPEGVLMEGEAA